LGWPANIGKEDRKQFIQDLHLYKTDQFRKIVESGIVPLRPGGNKVLFRLSWLSLFSSSFLIVIVQRLIDEAFSQDILVAVCSTSNEQAVSTIVNTLLGPERAKQMRIFAGDMVSKKKPSPDIYLLAAESLQVDPSRCWVIEDSGIGIEQYMNSNIFTCF
jgi:phosphoglycolate phosphatase-like HAD superfamily hydrolase